MQGKTLETPERVPFRLTHNIVDALGVTGPEGRPCILLSFGFDGTHSLSGLFRIACEITLQILRTNKDCLMSVLDAFIHDPLMEWEDEKRRLVRAVYDYTGARVADQLYRIESQNTRIITT